MKTFFNYTKQLKNIRKNLRLYNYTIYDKYSYIEYTLMFYYVILLLTYFFKGMRNKIFYFTIHLNEKKINEEISDEIFERMRLIICSNGFKILGHVKSFTKFTFTISTTTKEEEN